MSGDKKQPPASRSPAPAPAPAVDIRHKSLEREHYQRQGSLNNITRNVAAPPSAPAPSRPPDKK